MPTDHETKPPSSLEELWDKVVTEFREGDKRMGKLETDVQDLHGKMVTVETKVDTNTEVTMSIKKDTAGLVEAWTIGEKTGKFARLLGELAMWVVKAAIALGIVWATFKHLVK